jgi:hypothetical protein
MAVNLFVINATALNSLEIDPHPLPVPSKRLCRSSKNRVQTRRKRRSGMLDGLPGSGLSKDNETLPKVLEQQPLHVRLWRSISLR